MDNKIFNVNGRTKEQLRAALDLLLMDEYGGHRKVEGWYFLKDKGFVLTWHADVKLGSTAFTNALGQPKVPTHEELTDILWEWLKSPDALSVPHTGWDHDADHDGDNELGWRLYTEDWGCVNRNGGIDHYSIAALKPAYLWYGK